jgi:hypothetical protein
MSPTDTELEVLFRSWWSAAGYSAPPGPHALMTHLGWARWLLEQQGQQHREVQR